MNTYGDRNYALIGGGSKALRRPRTRLVSPHPTKLVITTAGALRATDGWPGAVGRPIDYMPSDLMAGRRKRR